MDDLFVRHTYLSAVIGMVVQASFGIDIRRLAETDPADLLLGRELYRATGLHGVLESGLLRLAQRGRGQSSVTNSGSSRGAIRLGSRPTRHCGNPV